MDDSFRVSRGQRVRNLGTHIEQHAERQRVTADALPQGFPLEQLHRNETLSVVFANFVDRADVGMIECGRGTSFSAEPFKCLRILRQLVGQEFQRNKTAKRHVLRFVDDAHAAAPEFFQDAVVRYGPSDERVRARHSAAILG